MELSGNMMHQKILRILMDLFQKDENIQALIIFGSLVRGDWDDYSDLDLDAVVKDDSKDKVQDEIRQMQQVLESAGLKILIAFEEFTNELVLIFDTLDRLSIRFHLLSDTKPAIIDSMKVLTGSLTETEIKKTVVKKVSEDDLMLLNNKFLELSVYVPISLKRKKFINALFFLNKMRQTLINMYVKSRGHKREFEFESIAGDTMKRELYATYTSCEEDLIGMAFSKLLDIYLNNISEIRLGKLVLTDNQKALLSKVKKLLG